MDKEFLADRWQMMPEDRIKAVTLYRRLADSALDTGNPITVEAADKRPLEIDVATLLEGTELEIETATFHLYVSTFLPTHDPSTVANRIKRGWVIEESNGDRWKVQRATLKHMETRYHVHCTWLPGKISG